MPAKDKGFAHILLIVLGVISLVLVVGWYFLVSPKKNRLVSFPERNTLNEMVSETDTLYTEPADITPNFSCNSNNGLGTETCTVPDGKFTFTHPKSFQVFTLEESRDHRGENLVVIYVYDPNKSYYSLTKESLAELKEKLEQGSQTLEERYSSPFSAWSGDAKIQILNNGSFALVSTTFGAFEVCNRQFSRRVEFVSNEKIFVIVVEGDIEQIFGELPPEHLTYEFADTCNGNAGLATWSLETLAGASAAANGWIEASEQVIQTLSFEL